MRKTKEIKINDKTVNVFELSVRDIKKLWADITSVSPETKEVPILTNDELLRMHWSKCVHGLELADTDDLTPSEMKLIYDAFAEVNADFFALALRLEGEDPFLKAVREMLLNTLILRFAVLFQKDTPESSTTATDSSQPQSPKA